jgi:hypothetical protein
MRVPVESSILDIIFSSFIGLHPHNSKNNNNENKNENFIMSPIKLNKIIFVYYLIVFILIKKTSR